MGYDHHPRITPPVRSVWAAWWVSWPRYSPSLPTLRGIFLGAALRVFPSNFWCYKQHNMEDFGKNYGDTIFDKTWIYIIYNLCYDDNGRIMGYGWVSFLFSGWNQQIFKVPNDCDRNNSSFSEDLWHLKSQSGKFNANPKTKKYDSIVRCFPQDWPPILIRGWSASWVDRREFNSSTKWGPPVMFVGLCKQL